MGRWCNKPPTSRPEPPASYEDVNDAERLSIDPMMRHVVGGRAGYRTAASTSQVDRFETEILTTRKNLKSLVNVPSGRPPTGPLQHAEPKVYDFNFNVTVSTVWPQYVTQRWRYRLEDVPSVLPPIWRKSQLNRADNLLL